MPAAQARHRPAGQRGSNSRREQTRRRRRHVARARSASGRVGAEGRTHREKEPPHEEVGRPLRRAGNTSSNRPDQQGTGAAAKTRKAMCNARAAPQVSSGDSEEEQRTRPEGQSPPKKRASGASRRRGQTSRSPASCRSRFRTSRRTQLHQTVRAADDANASWLLSTGVSQRFWRICTLIWTTTVSQQRCRLRPCATARAESKDQRGAAFAFEIKWLQT